MKSNPGLKVGAMAARRADIPLSIIAGYLGAGKTTLINHLLASDHGLRLAVLVNDFGALNIDADLIASHDGETYSLTNGCVCCTIADDLGTTLERLIRAEQPPEHIILEASGVAEPAKLAVYGGGWPGLALRAVVVLIDAESIRQRARDKFVGGLVRRQLAAGDLLLLNKMDLLGPDQAEELRSWFHDLGLSGIIMETRHAALPVDVLLAESTGMAATAAAPQAADGNSDHDETFISVLIEDHRPWQRQKLTAVLEHMPAGLMRAKGSVYLADDPLGDNFLQWVATRWSIQRRGSLPAGRGVNQLVLVALKDDVDPNDLIGQFKSCT